VGAHSLARVAPVSRLLVKRAAGLHLGANNLGSIPEGAFKRLENCVLQAADTVECRRGFELAAAYGPAGVINAVTFFDGKTFAHHTDVGHAQKFGYDNGAAWVDYAGSYQTPDFDPFGTPPVFQRPRYATAQRRLYMTSRYGIKRTDAFATAPERSGLQRCDVSWNRTYLIADAAGPIGVNTAVAYRAMLVRKDVNGLELQGPPSGRTVLRNPSGQVVSTGNAVRTSNVVTVTTPLPHGLRTGDAFIVPIGGDAPPNFLAGSFVVTYVPSPTSFTYSQAGPDETSLAGLTYETGQARADVHVTLAPEARAGDILRLFRSENAPTAGDEPSDDVYLVSEFVLAAGDITTGYVVVSDLTPSGVLGTSALAYFSPSDEGLTETNERPPYGRELCVFDQSLFVANLNEPQRLELRLVATGGTFGLADGDEITFAKFGGAGSFMVKGYAGGDAGALGSGHFMLFTGGEVFDDNERTAISIVNAINEHASNDWVHASYVSGFDDLPGLISLELIQSTYADHSTTFSAFSTDHPTAWVPEIGPLTGARSKGERRKARIRWSKQGKPEAFPPGNYVDAGDDDEAVLRCIPLGERVFILKERSLWVLSGSRPYRCDQVGGPIAFIGADTAAILSGRIFAFTSLGVVAISESGVELVGLPIEEATRAFTGATLSHVKGHAFGCGDEGGGRYLLLLPEEGDDDGRPTHAYVWNALANAWSHWPKPMNCAAVSPYTGKLHMGATYPSGNRIAVERKTLTRADYQDEAGEGIACVAQWQTFHMGAPELLKQVTEIKPLFRSFEVEAATLSVETEESVGGVAQTLSRRGYVTGEAFTGSALPYNGRLTPPREKGLAQYFDVWFSVDEAEALWKLQGLALEFEVQSGRAPK
jgi:hypothetical protein